MRRTRKKKTAAPHRIAPSCRCHDAAEVDPPEPPSWATRTLFGSAWFPGWPPDRFLSSTPAAGFRTPLAVAHPFLGVWGVPFTVLYQPPGALMDGWEAHPGEMSELAVVTCRLAIDMEERPGPFEGRSLHWATVKVDEVLSVVLLLTEPAATMEKPAWLDGARGSELGAYRVIRSRDGARWWLLRRHEGALHLLLEGDRRSEHADYVYAGHAVVDAAMMDGVGFR